MKLESSFRRTQKRLVFAPPGFKPVTEEAMGGMPGLIEAAKKLGSIVIRDKCVLQQCSDFGQLIPTISSLVARQVLSLLSLEEVLQPTANPRTSLSIVSPVRLQLE